MSKSHVCCNFINYKACLLAAEVSTEGPADPFARVGVINPLTTEFMETSFFLLFDDSSRIALATTITQFVRDTVGPCPVPNSPTILFKKHN